MNVSIGTIEGSKTIFDKAADKFETEKAAMFRPDGGRIWADKQHDERIASMLETVTRAASYVQEEHNAAIAQAKAARVGEHADPLSTLSNDELVRASALRTFVEDFVNSTPLDKVAQRLEAILVAGNKGEIAIYHAVTEKRLETLRNAARNGGNATLLMAGATAVFPHLEAMSAKLADPKIAKAVASAKELEAASYQANKAVQQRLRELNGEDARARAASTAFYRQNF